MAKTYKSSSISIRPAMVLFNIPLSHIIKRKLELKVTAGTMYAYYIHDCDVIRVSWFPFRPGSGGSLRRLDRAK